MSQLPSVQVMAASRLDAPLIVAGCFEDDRPELGVEAEDLQEAALRAASRPGWRGRREQVAEVALDTRQGSTLSLQGLGKSAEFDLRKLESWLTRALQGAAVNGASQVGILLPVTEAMEGRAAAERIGRKASLVSYRFDRYRNAPKPHRLKRILLVPPKGAERQYRAALKTARAVSLGTCLARDLANTPPNVATPQWLASEARRLARSYEMKARVLGLKDMKRHGMGGLLAVGQGSAHPPRLVRLEWGKGPPTVALVGKGVTFDTGGISIKPASSLPEMKYDKCGACTVLGIAKSVAELRLPLRLRVYLPLAENMPDGTAYRPSDIVRCHNGKTVEILNTDAEGRMILADALSWAAGEKPDWLVELSTLTGAAVVALGQSAASLYSPHDPLADDLLDAAEATGERLWRMPLWSEFVEAVKGTHADLRNQAGRWGGANTAAAFLSQFVGPLESWAHVDIAGPAYEMEGEASGATGYGVATVVRWLQGLERHGE